VNKQIIVAAIVIGVSGISNAWINSRPITTVVIGSYIFLLVLAFMDMYGGSLSMLSGGLAMVAATYVLLTEFPWKQVIGLVQGK
jgi:hypothetical protein